jgi:cell division protein ZapA
MMEQEGGILKINIYGTEYPIRSDANSDPEYIRKVADYVDRKMKEIDSATEAKSSLKVAILAALNIADELYQERQIKDDLVSQMSGKIKNLSDSLDKQLTDDPEISG